MKRLLPRKILPVSLFCLIPVMAAVPLLAWSSSGSRVVTATSGLLAAADPNAEVQITIGANVPHDVPGGQRLPSTDDSDVKLAVFAWQQFLALSWQSNYNSTTHSRGTPDANWDYAKQYKAGQPLVWETYAHKSELRPYGVPLDKPFNKAPEYIFDFATTPISPMNGARFDLFNNLDEDNEIGSCDVYHGNGLPSTQPLVLYQAKVNQSEYDYIKSQFGKDQYVGPSTDKNGQPILGGALSQAQAANANSIKTNKAPAANGINLPAGDNNGGEGAIEIKTAFLLVTPENSAALKGFFQTQAIYYKMDDQGKYYYYNGTFALLSIHVIHKTVSYPDFIFTSFEHVSLSKMGFQYILTTPLAMEFPGSNFNPFHAVPPSGALTGTQFGVRQPIIRQSGNTPISNGQLYPIPETLERVTKTVHSQLAKLNPNSVWLNYRLMGVQANITEKWALHSAEGAGPNHFMANFVVESDAFLGNFFGPGFGTNPFPTGEAAPPIPPNTKGNQNGDNVLYKGKTYNMGGCKGCHGVAQTSSGTDFSFLLDFGANKPVITPDTILYSPNQP
jgi:hypothetical protein